MQVAWARTLGDRPVLVASCLGVVAGLVGRALPLRLALLITGTGDGGFECDSPYPIDCMFSGAFAAIPLLIELLVTLAAVTLGFVAAGLLLLAVSGVRIRQSTRAGGHAAVSDRVVVGAGFALLTAAVWTVAPLVAS